MNTNNHELKSCYALNLMKSVTLKIQHSINIRLCLNKFTYQIEEITRLILRTEMNCFHI